MLIISYSVEKMLSALLHYFYRFLWNYSIFQDQVQKFSGSCISDISFKQIFQLLEFKKEVFYAVLSKTHTHCMYWKRSLVMNIINICFCGTEYIINPIRKTYSIPLLMMTINIFIILRLERTIRQSFCGNLYKIKTWWRRINLFCTFQEIYLNI